MQAQNFKCLLAAVLLISVQGNYGLGFPNILQSVVDKTTNTVKAIPTPEEFFDFGKQALVGQPLETVFDAIDVVCSAALGVPTVTPRITPNMDRMNFQLMTACNNYTFPLTEPSKMWESEHFNNSKKVVIFAAGFVETFENSLALRSLKQPYLCRDDVNFIVIDVGNLLDTLFTWTAFNSDAVGRNIALGLVNLAKVVSIEKVHLIGHSLGAHIIGAAGRYFTEFTNQSLPRITGLDPANPCFNEGESLSGLLHGDALFVDVIHSNAGVMGTRDPIGDADYYPGGFAPLAPGTISIIDSHLRSVEYFSESVHSGNENNFLGVSCKSMSNLRDGKCNTAKVAMGYAAPNYAKGIYLLEVNDESPYGQELPKKEALQNIKNCNTCAQ